ncbi:MAG: DNA polymerase III subunit gamma/tau, partial [Syntrophales bacterium]|nr:DNA polymerase III subunit gamma/tau [Syntrophales bacterium]
MEYRVLARKWRPQVFEDVLGQEHVVRTLKNAIGQQRIAHAFLFSGPRGVGKTSIARILAKALNCETGPTPTPCNQCGHCVEITNGNAIDVREIDGASNRGIDEIRELRENVKFAPASCRYKIYIIDEVHMLTREAFNALLKTLEEPPGHVIFIFATTEAQKVPATILSRCQCFDFRRIPLKQIAENLKKIAASDGIRISDNGLSWIAEAGDGSLRDSQSIFDQVISYAGFEIGDPAVEEILGRSDRRFLFMLSEAVLARDAGRCLRIIDEAYYAGLDMRYFYQTLLGHFRNLLFTAIAADKEPLVDLPAEEAAKLKGQTAGQSPETLQRYLEILMAEEESVRRSQSPRLNLEAVLCRMAFLEPMIPIEAVLTRMEGLERRLTAGPVVGGTGGSGGGRAAEIRREAAMPGESKISAKSGAWEEAGAAYSANRERATHLGAGGGVSAAGGVGEASPAGGLNSAPPGGVTEVSATAATVAAEESAPYRSGAGAGGGGIPEKNWQGYREFVKRQDPALCAKIESGRCLCCEPGFLRIGFEKGYFFLDDVVGRKAALAEHGRQFFGRETALEIETFVPEAGGSTNGRNGNGNGNGRA